MFYRGENDWGFDFDAVYNRDMSLKVHHLNCGTLCPHSRLLYNGKGGLFEPGTLVCHCLLIETQEGLVLVDTGIGKEDIQHRFLNLILDLFSPPKYYEYETAYAQVKALGFDPKDVQHIVLTHLDVDHAGGLRDFPWAKVHLHAHEHHAAIKSPAWTDHFRYLPRQWRHHPHWETYDYFGGEWMGFEAVKPLKEVTEDILLVPLVGHTRGHCGVAVNTENGWLLHAGDAYFHHHQLKPFVPTCPPALALIQTIEQWNWFKFANNVQRLGELHQTSKDLRIVCSHDPEELQQCQTLTHSEGFKNASPD